MINALITPTEKEIEDAQKKMMNINKITRAKR
jgi:gamma-glutamylcysteine synthetase